MTNLISRAWRAWIVYRARRALALAAQAKARYPYCREGYSDCGDMNCGCTNNPLNRLFWRISWLERNP